MNHLNMEVKIVPNKITYEEKFEIPTEAIREILVNAVCHRSLTDNSRVQVAIYDDRVEITSPGILYNGLTLKGMLEGKTAIRNACLANVLTYLNLIENWGTGVQRAILLCKEAGIQEPEFIEMDSAIRVNFYRPSYDAQENAQENAHDYEKLNSTQIFIYNAIKSDKSISRKQLLEITNKDNSTITRAIRVLKDKGYIKRVGSDRRGFWKILK